ncbi:Trigger factor [compost metagenome]
MAIGETREIQVTFPENYHSENLSGKEVTFKVKLNEIKAKELPELDDEFAKDVSEFETLKEYRESVAQKVKENKEKRAKMEKESKVVEKIIENIDVVIPEGMVESQIDESLEQFAANLSYQGLTLEKYAELTGSKMEDLRNQFREGAQRDVKLKLALEYIAQAENVEVTAEDINVKIDELATQYGSENSENLKQNENVKRYMEEKLKQEKALAIAVDSAIEK